LIDADLLEKHAPKIDQGDALIIHTGWDRMWNKPGYVLQGPNMRRNALEWVLEQRISILGVDIPCIEASWSEDNPEEKGGFLGALFGQDILLLAPLVNLDQVSGSEGQLICLPMKVKGTSGAPVRVIFLEKV
ncbi:MAG: cyclase family protein, partial [Atribacterota bacterium]